MEENTFWLEQREKRDFKESEERMAATIADVANLAGCSIATVSRAFSVPDRLAIIGYDGSSLCRVTEPELSSVRVDGSGMGRRGAHMLIDLIEGRLLSESRVVMQLELTLRETTEKEKPSRCDVRMAFCVISCARQAGKRPAHRRNDRWGVHERCGLTCSTDGR